MKNEKWIFKKNPKKVKSIQREILISILPFIMISMILLSALGYYSANQMIKTGIGKERLQSLNTAVERIEKSLSNNRKVSEALATAVHANKNVMGELQYGDLLPSMVQTNYETFGAGIWFEPFAYNAQKEYYSPYCMRENGSPIFFNDYSLGEDRYTDQEWYTNVKGIKDTKWSAPYYDEYAKISMVTSSTPFFDEGGNFIGVATADIDLTEMQKMIAELETVEGEKAFLIDQNGTYIADRDTDKLLKMNIKEESDSSMSNLGIRMLEEKTGKGEFKFDGETYQAWYTEVPESGWIIAVASSNSLLYKTTNMLAAILVILCILITGAVTALTVFTVRKKIVQPLHTLTGVMNKISEGDFSIEANTRTDNEIGVLIQKTVSGLKEYTKYIEESSYILEQISQGNLDYTLRLNYVGEFGKLKTALQDIQLSLTNTLSMIAMSAAQVDNGATQVSSGAHALATSSTEQAATVEELNAAVAQIADKAEENFRNVTAANEYSDLAAQAINTGNEYMQTLTQEMERINESSDQIANITKTIEDIAFQTNILALNAAIEAARAGEAGKGFAVVADEVRNLAAKSAQATKHTAQLIANSTQTVEEGTKIADRAAQILEEVQEKYVFASESMQKIQEASAHQTESIEHIKAGLNQISSVVQGNAATAEENSATSEVMSSQATMLRKEIERFRFAKQEDYTWEAEGGF